MGIKIITALTCIIFLIISVSASEVIKRTASTETVKNPDGTITLTLYGGEVFMDLNKGIGKPNYVPVNDSYFPIINSNISNYVFQLDNTYARYNAYFKNNSNTASAVRFEKDGYFLEYDLSGGQLRWHEQPGFPARTDTLGGGVPSNSQDTTAEAKGNIVTYPGAFSNTNLTYHLQNNMLKEIFILTGLPSIKPYTYLEYSGNIKFTSNLSICANNICYKPSGTQDNFETSGQIDFKDIDNNTIFYLPSPSIIDSANNSITGFYSVHGSNAQMNFWLRIPTSFIQTATFPIFIDPTINLNEPSSEILKDATVSALNPTTNYGTDTVLYVSKNRGFYIQFNLTQAYQPNMIMNITQSYAKFGMTSASGGLPTPLLYYLTNDWQNSSGLGNILSETQITWNNQPCGTTFSNSTFCNLTYSVLQDGNYDYNVTDILSDFVSNSKQNISFFVRNLSTALSDSSFIQYASKDYSTANSRPNLELTYRPYINIISPSATTYTSDAPIVSLNVSTNENMTSCRWSPNAGLTNYTMSNLNDTYYWDLNITMPDGENNVTFYCNNSDNTWRYTDITEYTLDVVNITKCRILSVSRTYHLLNNLTDGLNSICFTTSESNSQNLVFDGNYNFINKSDGMPIFDFDNSAGTSSIFNLTIYTNGSIIKNTSLVLENVFDSINLIGMNGYAYLNSRTWSTGNFIVRNSVFNNTIIKDNTYGTPLYIINSTYNNVSESIVTTSSKLFRQWYFDANVTYLLGNLSTATVQGFNTTSSVFTTTTDTNGIITRQTITEYISNKTGTEYQTPHTINISKSGFATNSTIYNFTLLKSSVSQQTLLIDNQVPVITINSPLNQQYTTNESLSINFDVSDNVNTSACWYKVINSTGSIIINNVSLINCLDTTFNLTGTDDDYNLTIFANDTTNNIGNSVISFGIRINSPGVNLIYPTNNLWVKSGNNSLFNFTASFTSGLDTCKLYADFNGTFLVNYTWINPPNATANWTYVNLTDGLYEWNVACNNSNNLVGWGISNYSYNIDGINPNVSLTNVGTVLGSKTIYFTPSISDSNLNSSTCVYSVFDSSNEINNDLNNTSFSCNSITSFDVTAFGTYNLTIFAEDYAKNNDSLTQTFTISQATLSIGGGGSLSVSTLKIPVIGIIALNVSNNYSNLELETIYARLNDECLYKIKAGQTISVADYSEVCTLTTFDLELVAEKLAKLNIFVPIEDLKIFYSSYKKQALFQGLEIQSVVDEYDLFTSVLGDVNVWTLSPPSIDKNKIIAFSNSTKIIELIYSNKPIIGCEVLNNNTDLTCEISNATIKLTYDFRNKDFFNKVFMGVVSVTSSNKAGEIEQKKVPVYFRVYNMNYKFIGIPVYILLIILGFLIIIGIYYSFKLNRKRKSGVIKDIFSTNR